MAVPKKRKKLDEDILVSPVASTEGEKISSEAQSNPKKRSTPKTSKPRNQKVTDAFDVVDQIDKTSVSGTLEVQKFQPQSEQGIHIQFKLDLIRLEDILEIGNPKEKEKKDNSIVVDFTIPYIWNLPILNEVTRTIVIELKKMKIIQ